MGRPGLIILGMLIALGVAVFVLVNVADTVPARAPASSVGGGDLQTSEDQDRAAESRVEISADEYAFTPQTFSLEKGVVTEIALKNTGSGTHSLIIPGLNVETESIGPGEETSVEITPSTTGEFGFGCNIANHKELGMEGKVMVE